MHTQRQESSGVRGLVSNEKESPSRGWLCTANKFPKNELSVFLRSMAQPAIAVRQWNCVVLITNRV